MQDDRGGGLLWNELKFFGQADVDAAWIQQFEAGMTPETLLSWDIETPYKLKAKDDDDVEEKDRDYEIIRISFAHEVGSAVSVEWSPTYLPAIQHLLESGGGSVINTASFVAVMGAAVSQISYTASKGAVLAMSREMGVEFARRGVRVNALCPGPVNTPLLQELFASDPAKAARRLVHLPMGRFAEASEIAQAAVFLASDESSYVTASTFLVDGGLSGAYLTPETGE